MTRRKPSGEKAPRGDRLRADAEAQLARSPDAAPTINAHAHEKIVHELRVHQIELEMQNEELRRAHLAVEVSRDKYRDLYDFAPLGYVSFTRWGRIVEVNLTGAALLGEDRHVLLTQGFGRLVAPDDRDQWEQHLVAVWQSGEPRSCELTLMRKDGTWFQARLDSIRLDRSAAPAEGLDATAVIRTAVSDITDRKRAEEALRLSMENLRLATGAARIGLWFWDLCTGHLEWTPICKALFGLPADQVMSYEAFLKAVHPADRERTDLAVRHSLSRRSQYRIEYRTVWPDASEHWLLALGQGCYDKQGQPMRMVGIVLDITDRRQAEEGVALYKQIFEYSSEAIAILDLQGRYLEQNDAHRVLAGHADDELCGQSPEIHIGADALAAILRDIASRGVHRGEHVGRAKDGRALLLDLSVFAVRDATGEPLCYVEIERDVTQRKNIEQQLRQAEKMAAMGMLIAGVSHEINNPLFALSGYIELASERVRYREYEGLAEDLAAMGEAVARATAMVQRFLGVARSSARHRGSCAVNGVVEEGLALVANDCHIHGIEISRDLAPDLPRVEADPQELLQVLLNLFTNARQAMTAQRRGTLSVTTALAAAPRLPNFPPASRGAWVEIRVQDDGPGIAPELLGRVFEPFFTSKPVGEGTGLGLSIAHRIVTEHQGTITCRSSPGLGATFVIRLPVGTSDRQDAES